VRVHDTGSDKPCVLIVPDGPNLIEHYAVLIGLLSERYRVVCFDMPGFGHSLPAPAYDYSLEQGAAAVQAVMDALGIDKATFAFSCANGFYALRFSQLAPQRVTALVLSQTPSLPAMHAWAKRVVPGALHLPVIGEIGGWIFRRKAASGWYRMSLPAGADGDPMRKPALAALNHGACFCLSGVVQGLNREPAASPLATRVPCVLAWGTLDRSHRFTDPLSLKQVMPEVEVVLFEQCGHFPDLEDPQRFARLLQDTVDAAGCRAAPASSVS
jgi:pimeloyl-ACP methyl ester carboxylesterase